MVPLEVSDIGSLLTLDEGMQLTQFARKVIEEYIQNQRTIELPIIPSKTLLEPRGVFVTIKKRNQREPMEWILRGCIGRLQPGPGEVGEHLPLLEATKQAALSSALEDPRFPPVRLEELDSILIEVSVLTIPEEISIKDRKKISEQISIGEDGLIIDAGGWHKGLLLPQVAPEQKWNATEFLEGCCRKAGVSSNSYLDPNVKVYKFQAQIFAEDKPRGNIYERKF